MSQNRVSNVLDLVLRGMDLANLVTPQIANIFSIVRKGREAGKDDEAVIAETQQYIDSVIGKADAQLAVKPTGTTTP